MLGYPSALLHYCYDSIHAKEMIFPKVEWCWAAEARVEAAHELPGSTEWALVHERLVQDSTCDGSKTGTCGCVLDIFGSDIAHFNEGLQLCVGAQIGARPFDGHIGDVSGHKAPVVHCGAQQRVYQIGSTANVQYSHLPAVCCR